MTPADFVHLSLHALGGEIQGKTMLQKKVYFLGVFTDMLNQLGYRPHFYGPYSDDVAQAVQELRTIGYVEQQIRSAGSSDAAGFERCRYDYHLTDAGTRVAKSKAAANRILSTELQRVADRLNRAGNVNYMKLSVAAKTYFLLGQTGVRPSEDELARLASKFGWRVTPEETSEAAVFLDKLGLMGN